MKITLKDGKQIEFDGRKTGREIAASISISLAKAAIAIKVEGEIFDLERVIDSDAHIEIITAKSVEAQDIINHSAAHLLAQAIMELYPGALLAFGPAIEEGFFYDIHFLEAISENDLPNIEKKMHEIVDRKLIISRKELSLEEAKVAFKDQRFKLEHLDEILPPYSVYQQGDFVDLCRGPHVANTSLLKNFKLLSLAGAYYKGDQKNIQLTRIYGTAFFTKEELIAHLQNLEDRKLSDHRKLGKELELFMMSDFGPGFPFFLPKGMILRKELENYWYKLHTDYNYEFIMTPVILSRQLWETSGHWLNYHDNMYTTIIDEDDYAIKPMNCPGAILVYQNKIHSYRDFPLRVGELGLVHRHEASGALNGLFRVRNFTQDDAHIFLTNEQLEEEIKTLLKIYDDLYKTFNLPYYIVLSTRPENKFIGSIETWNESEAILARCLQNAGIDYKINEGDGAFYGPKLDFKLRDSMNRIWQCGTVQLDMNLPERFDLYYIDKDGSKRRPVMLHRAIFGSLERFIGILIEHFKGAFPTWLAPEQVRLLPVNNEAHLAYANSVKSALNDAGIRATIDDSNEKLNYRIRLSLTLKTPYTIILGNKEVDGDSVSYRLYGQEETLNLPLGDFITLVKEDIKLKKINRSK